MSRFLIKSFPYFASFTFLALVFYPPFLINSSSHFEVYDCADLQAIGSNAGDHVGWTLASDYMLMNNIDCSDTVNWNGGEGFAPIGGPNELVFTGSLNGQNFTISDLFIECDTCDGLGLFAITLGAAFQDINFDGGSITATNTNFAGSLVGMADGGTTIENVSSNMPITVDGGHVGGIAGSIEPNGSITNSFSTGNITNQTGPAGGLVGGIYTSSINNSCSSGNIISADWGVEVGGLVGYSSRSTITRSYATGDVSANYYAGGLVGHFRGDTGLAENYYVSESFASGAVTSIPEPDDWGYSGGLIGYLDRGSINNSYSIGNASSANGITMGGLVGETRGVIISNSYATGTISGTNWVGGLVGELGNASFLSEIENSFSASEIVSAGAEIGGLVGYVYANNTITNSFYDFIRSGSQALCVGLEGAGSNIGCTAVNTVGVPNTNYFFNNTTNPPLDTWDFDTVWLEQEGTYPVLRFFEEGGIQACGPQVLGASEGDPEPSVTLTAVPDTITAGESFNLSWTSTDTLSCSADWTDSTATSGDEDLSPTETTLYTITCVNGAFSDGDSVSVTVNPAPEEGGSSGGGARQKGPAIQPPIEDESVPPPPPPVLPPPVELPQPPVIIAQVTPTQETPTVPEPEEPIEEGIVVEEIVVDEPLVPVFDPRLDPPDGMFGGSTPSIDEMVIYISSIALLGGGMATALQVISTPNALSILNARRGLNPLGIFLGSRRRKNPWGTIYDSSTKEPLDPAMVTLLSQDGKEISSAITDLDGRYGFIAPPGVYQIAVEKTNYGFPSRRLFGKTRDLIYDNLYFGGNIVIEGDKPLVTRDIPMDSQGFDWNQAEKRDTGVTRFFSRHELFIQRFTSILIFLGTIWSGISFYLNQNTYNFLILLGYLVVIVIRHLAKPQRYGKVFDKSGDVLKFALVKVFQASTNIEIRHTITDSLGRYFCLVPNGEYYVKVEKRVGPEALEPAFTSEPMNIKNGILKEIFRI